MRFLILGPLEVINDARPVALAQGRTRLLLAALLLERNEVVSSDELIETLWGESPPPSAAGSLHNLVSGLRKALGARVVTRGHGYVLTVEAGELDRDDFDALAAGGHEALADRDATTAAALLADALALWRGPALGELAYELAPAARRLEDARLSALEDRVDADLELGRHAGLIAELTELVERNPLRERLLGQYMLALYRGDRQAEALAAYHEYRCRLDAELGLSPAPALRALEQSILEHDPAMALPRRAALTRRPRRLAFGGAGLAVLVALVVVLARNGDGGSASRGSPVRVTGDALAVIDPGTNRVTASYAVGATPVSASVGGGAAWAVSADAQTVSRIDLRDRSTRTFGTGSIPLEVAASRDALWLVVADAAGARGPFAGAPAQLSRIDPVSAAVAASTPLVPRTGPGLRGSPGLIAVDAHAVWAVGRDGRLLRLDRGTGAAREVRGFTAVSVAADHRQVWAIRETHSERQRNLVQLDPASGRVIDRVLVPWASAASLAVGAGAVWITDPYAGVVWRIDPGPHVLQRTVPVEFGVDSIAADRRSIWVANSVTGVVSRIDPATSRVSARVAVHGTPRSVALGAGRVWVAVAGGERGAAATALAPGKRVQPLATAGCGPALGGRSTDLLIAADLPTQGRFTTTDGPVAEAIAWVLRAHNFKAGRFRLALQTCDDSIAASGGPDEGKCKANARAYAGNPAVIGVIGPIHSFCAAAMLPILNRAPGGPVNLVSPTNSRVSLVRDAPGVPAAYRRTIYPTGQRGYARLVPADDIVLAALALAVKQSGVASAFYLSNPLEKGGEIEVYFRRGARRAGLPLAGSAAWKPSARTFRPLARQVRDSGAKAVVLNGSVYFQVARVIRDLRRVLGPDFPIWATEGVLPIVQLFDEAGPAARGVRVATGGAPLERLDATGRRFLRRFAATQPGGKVPQWAVYAAAATEVLLDAIARSDGTRESVAQALATTDLAATPVGPLTLDRRGEPTVAHVTIVRAERAGAPEYAGGIEGGTVERVITLP